MGLLDLAVVLFQFGGKFWLLPTSAGGRCRPEGFAWREPALSLGEGPAEVPAS